MSRWYTVVDAVVDSLRDDSPQPVVWDETAIHMATDAGPVTVPSVTWFIVADTEQELWNPVLVQWDIFAATLSQANTIETWLREWLHHDLPTTFGSVAVWSQLVDSRQAGTPENMNPGIVHWQMDVRFTALRTKYVAIT